MIALSREALEPNNDNAKTVAAVLAAAAFEDTIRKMGATFAQIENRRDLSEVLLTLRKQGLLEDAPFTTAQSYLRFRNDSLHADWAKMSRCLELPRVRRGFGAEALLVGERPAGDDCGPNMSSSFSTRTISSKKAIPFVISAWYWETPRLARTDIRMLRPLPNLTGGERFVRSINEEGLDRWIPFGEGHCRRPVAESVTHYHRERNHQGLGAMN